MAAVGAADLRGVGLGLGDGDALGDEHGDRWRDDAVRALAIAERVRGVDDVVARRTEVHEALGLVGDLVADHVDERAHVVSRACLLVGDLLCGNPIGGAGDRIRDVLIGDADVRESERQSSFDSRHVLDRGCRR